VKYYISHGKRDNLTDAVPSGWREPFRRDMLPHEVIQLGCASSQVRPAPLDLRRPARLWSVAVEMKHLRIIPGRWHRRLRAAWNCNLTRNSEARLIQTLFSTAGGGGPPR
jgi:hypothetical protein